MRLDKIKLSGFKSFVDPTTVYVPSNLFGVVGPNGCGKSNIIDAVRWVMGESSAKHLRGESMADVIFNGSSSRKPVGHANIELIFDNSDGTIGGEYAAYAEIAIKRQVSRDGTSNYFLNGARCRRRDITGIFLGTGLGPRSYSIIEQGMISRLIEAKPEELRVFLEEAAGISKYKERRRETENRIRHTRDNLSRINDLREEIEKQLQHLQRQAKTAERYKNLKQEERQLKAELLALRLRVLKNEAATQEKIIKERETALEAAIADQRSIETSIEKDREAHTEANDEFNEVQGRYYGLGGEIARNEQAIQHSKDTRLRQKQDLDDAEQGWQELLEHIDIDKKQLDELNQKLQAMDPALEEARTKGQSSQQEFADAEERMSVWQQDWDAFTQRSVSNSEEVQVERTRIDHLERQLVALVQRLERLSEEKSALEENTFTEEIEKLEKHEQAVGEEVGKLQQELDSIIQDIADRREQNRKLNGQLDDARSEMQNAKGRLASIEALQQAALGKSDGAVTEWLEGHGMKDAPRLAQGLRVNPGWERAVETVLGFNLEAVCLDGMDTVTSVLDSLKHGSLVIFDTRASADSNTTNPQHGVALSSKVSGTWDVDSLMAGVFCVESLNDAMAIRNNLATGESVITRDGIWLGKAWLRVARDADEKGGVIAREHDIKELVQQLADIESNVEQLQKQLDDGRSKLNEIELHRENKQEQVNEKHREHSGVMSQFNSLRSEHAHHTARVEAVIMEINEVEGLNRNDDSALAGSHLRLSTAMKNLEVLDHERSRLNETKEQLRASLESTREVMRQDNDNAHSIALQVGSMRSQLTSTEQSLQRMDKQLASLKARREQLIESLESSVAPMAEMQKELETLLGTRIEVESELSATRKKLEDIDVALRKHEQERSNAEQKVQDVRSMLEKARMDWQEYDVRRKTLEEQFEETGLDKNAALEGLTDEANVDEYQEKVDKIGQRINRLGPINLAAIDEFEEQSERKNYLDAQYADVTEALETLENAIRKIDRETRTRFKETYDKVNSGLKEMFPRLFGGGHAYLELTGDDLLDAGVSVMARPPGKRNSSIHLLSGGEKALTAVSLVFAIFQLNPSPFCMLDEVDAPLDDANVARFCDMVKEMSKTVQFVFITHNKITMSIADHLAGVTMHEPGVSRMVAVDVDEAVRLAAV